MEGRKERERDQVLRRFHTRLCSAVRGAGPTSIAQKLLEKDVLSADLCSELEDIPGLVDQSTKLMRAVRCSVIYDEDAFEALLDVLDTSTLSCKNLSKKLQQELDRRGKSSLAEPKGIYTLYS